MSAAVYVLIGVLIGLAFGFLWGLLLGRGRAGAPDDRLLGELRNQLTQRDNDLDRVRNEAAQARTAQAAAEARANSEQQHQEKALRQLKENQDTALADLRTAFKALSLDALRDLQPQFIERVAETVAKLNESARGDLAQRQQAIATLVEPLRQQLDTYQQRLQQAESAQSSTMGEVKKQLDLLAQQSLALTQETQQFRMVLHSNQARGRWGEETLRRVVEAAGMSAHCDFSEQAQAGDGKPDLLVRLPGERVIIVDAKVPDLNFLSALQTADPAERTERLAEHAAVLKTTIKALAERNYPSLFPDSLDYVVLFLPAESLFSAALEGDRDLIVWAAGKRILLATPASLIGLLRAVSVSWQQHTQTENARQIADAAREFYARVVKFADHFEGIRKGLEQAATAFNDAAGSFQTRVRPAGKRLADLGGAPTGKELQTIPPLEGTLRVTETGSP